MSHRTFHSSHLDLSLSLSPLITSLLSLCPSLCLSIYQNTTSLPTRRNPSLAPCITCTASPLRLTVFFFFFCLLFSTLCCTDISSLYLFWLDRMLFPQSVHTVQIWSVRRPLAGACCTSIAFFLSSSFSFFLIPWPRYFPSVGSLYYYFYPLILYGNLSAFVKRPGLHLRNCHHSGNFNCCDTLFPCADWKTLLLPRSEEKGELTRIGSDQLRFRTLSFPSDHFGDYVFWSPSTKSGWEWKSEF